MSEQELPLSGAPDSASTHHPIDVLVFSQHFWPEAFRINEIAGALRDEGCHVSVLTGQPNYPIGRIMPGHSAWRWGRTEYDGLPVFRVPIISRGRGSAARLVANYLSFIVAASLIGPLLLRGRRVDVVFVYGTSPILQTIAAIVIARIKRARVVTWVQDLWPESLEATGFVRNRAALALVQWIVRWIYRHSDLLLVQSQEFEPRVRALAGETPVRYHPNPGERSFDREDAISASVTLPKGFNIVFAGNLGTVQALGTIVGAAALLKDTPEIRFVIAGDGSKAEWLRSEIRRNELANVEMIGRLPVEEMPSLLAQSSAVLVTLASSPILALTVPSKVQAYLAAGKPIIASLDGAGSRVVSGARAGISCAAEDAAALAQAARTLYGMPSNALADMGRAGRHFYEQNFAPEMLAARLAGILAKTMRIQRRD